MDTRFKISLENQIREEVKKVEEMKSSDLTGSRVSELFTTKMQRGMDEIAKITDTQVLLTSTISLLRKSVSMLDESIREVNVSRREQQGRVDSLREYYTKFIEIEEIIKAEEKVKKQEESEEFSFTEEARRSQQIRRIGERPEKLKSMRNEESPK